MRGEIPKWVTVSIQVPRGSFVKRDDLGRADFVSPIPCPFNYGSVPGTLAADGEQADALVLGRRLESGLRTQVPVRAVVDFMDAGVADPKWVCCLAPLTQRQLCLVAGFFGMYALAKRSHHRLRGRRGDTAYRGLRVLSALDRPAVP